MKIKDRTWIARKGKKYEMIGASDGKMVSIKYPDKGWCSFFEQPEDTFESEGPKSPLRKQKWLFKVCDKFLQDRWPKYRRFHPNGNQFKK